jgi:putative hemolysin
MRGCASRRNSNFQIPTYTVGLAGTEREVFQCMQLRTLSANQGQPGLRPDSLDAHCHHLTVKEHSSGRTVATARLLFKTAATKSGGFDSGSKFHLEPILALAGHTMEMGKLCFHGEHRNPKVVNTLWQGLASLIAIHRIDYIFCTTTISIADGGQYAQRVAALVRTEHFSPHSLRILPKFSFPDTEQSNSIPTVLPNELKSYLRYGAVVCGEPYWNTYDQVAELLILLDCDMINQRYCKPLAEHI